MEKIRKTIMDRFTPMEKEVEKATPIKKAGPVKRPFSAGERVKQIKNVRKERENIMKELDN